MKTRFQISRHLVYFCLYDWSLLTTIAWRQLITLHEYSLNKTFQYFNHFLFLLLGAFALTLRCRRRCFLSLSLKHICLSYPYPSISLSLLHSDIYNDNNAKRYCHLMMHWADSAFCSLNLVAFITSLLLATGTETHIMIETLRHSATCARDLTKNE